MSLQHKALLGAPFRESALRALQPDRTRRSGWDVSDPPFSPTGVARKGLSCAGPNHSGWEGRSRPEMIPAGRLGVDR